MRPATHEVAWAWASGLIEFGAKEPRGALPIARGRRARLRAVVSDVARHAHDGRSLLVPGVPEAPSRAAAVDALIYFQKQVIGRLHRPATKASAA